MKVAKFLLNAFGALAICLVLGIAYMSMEATSFRRRHEPFIEKYLITFSTNWLLEDVRSLSSDEFLEIADSPDGAASIAGLKPLGKFQKMTSVEMKSLNYGTDGKSGLIGFQATFDHLKAYVEIVVIEKDDHPLVREINIIPADGGAMPKAVHSV